MGISNDGDGQATEALQTTGNASLSSIDGKLNSLGQKTSANSVPVVIASDQTLSLTSNQGLGNKTTYVCNTGPITGATAIGTKSLCYIFHGLLNITTLKLISIVVDQIAGNGPTGGMRIEMNRITGEALIPGGTSGTKKAKLSGTISGATFVIAPTSAPTREAGQCFSVSADPKSNGQTIPVGFNAIEGIEQTPWTINPLSSFGFEITQVVTSTLSTAPTFNITVEWTEA